MERVLQPWGKISQNESLKMDLNARLDINYARAKLNREKVAVT